jgi:beta-lactamase regulating signal transducer with metallopeptidase domain
MSFTFLQDELVLALCWTLIHSLWQGLLLAAATGIVMVSTRRSHARKRYTILTALFFLFIAVSVFTFCRQLTIAASDHQQVASSELTGVKEFGSVVVTPAAATAIERTGWLEGFVDYFNTHAAFIVTLWFIIFLTKFLKLSANLVYVQRLKSYKVSAPAAEWQEKLRQLMEKLNLRKSIRMVESGIVKVPMTMGIFKPVILLPLGLLSHLPADEIEAILLHELAHIQRRDYLVNLLQSAAETVFFFNPALLWLSSMIREERENCCDDLAIAVTNNKTNFINALISFQEYNLNKTSYGMAFPGNKHQLLNRVKRIISDRNKTLNAAEKSILSFGIALFVLFSLVAAKSAPRQQEKPDGPYKMNASPVRSAADKMNSMPGVRIDRTQVQPGGTMIPVPYTTDPVPSDINHKSVQHDEHLGNLHPLNSLPPMVASPAIRPDTIPEAYKNLSAQTNDDGDTRTVVMTATSKEGRVIEFKKVNDVVKAITINGKQIPQEEFSKHDAEIILIEAAVLQRKELQKLSQLDRLNQKLLRLQVDKSVEKTKKDAIEYQKQEIYKEKILDYQKKHKLSDSAVKLLFDKIQIPQAKWKLDKSVTYSPDKLRMDGKWKLDKNATYNADKKPEDVKGSGWKTVKDKSSDQYSPDTADENQFLKAAANGDVTWGDKRNKSADGPSQEKRKKLWQLQQEDERNRQVAAAVMLNIITDLEKENIKVDRDHSWFALDKSQFLVDGKPMPAEMHNRFRSKYVVPREGLGWYYGRVQVSGKGIFLGNDELKVK